jgi:glucose dehydrogenase
MSATKHFLLLGLIAPFAAHSQATQRADDAGEWRTYNHDLAGTRHSALAEIDRDNVGRLANTGEIAWQVTVGVADSLRRPTAKRSSCSRCRRDQRA